MCAQVSREPQTSQIPVVVGNVSQQKRRDLIRAVATAALTARTAVEMVGSGHHKQAANGVEVAILPSIDRSRMTLDDAFPVGVRWINAGRN